MERQRERDREHGLRETERQRAEVQSDRESQKKIDQRERIRGRQRKIDGQTDRWRDRDSGREWRDGDRYQR